MVGRAGIIRGDNWSLRSRLLSSLHSLFLPSLQKATQPLSSYLFILSKGKQSGGREEAYNPIILGMHRGIEWDFCVT